MLKVEDDKEHNDSKYKNIMNTDMKTETKYKVEGLNELSKQVNDFVSQFGFSNADRIALIHHEVSEAFEAFRKDRFANPAEYRNLKQDYTWEDSPISTNEFFERYMKDTFEDKIADAIIRLLDLCGNYGIDIENHIREKMAWLMLDEKSKK